MPNHYTSFSDLIQNAVLEIRRQHPDWIRLDGNVSGGNRNTFATFRYKYKTWKIHSDTTLDALLIAWELESAGKVPFEIAVTAKGNSCLRLPETLEGEADGLYVYLQR
jgi:hypothetical protein